MEEELEPFADEEYEPQEIDGRMALNLHGEFGKCKRVDADKIPKIHEAMREGWDIYIRYAVIDGDIDISRAGLESDEAERYIIAGKAWFVEVSFNGNPYFGLASFNRDVYFGGASFQYAYFAGASFTGDADFGRASFNRDACFKEASFTGDAFFAGASFTGDADFREASFNKDANFGRASFNRDAYFRGAKFIFPGRFAGVVIVENTVWRGLWNNLLRPLSWPVVWLFTIGRVKLPKAIFTDIYSINTNAVMDASGNPRLKRYIDDEQWIKSWRDNPKGRLWRKFAFWIWEVTSHCGRSIGLWAFWSFLFAFLFALAYTPAPEWMGDRWCNFWQEHGAEFEQTAPSLMGQPIGFWSCLYFSIVNFTTLGFGDIVAISPTARFLVGLEVVLGYVMLGGLISIFANKFARRS